MALEVFYFQSQFPKLHAPFLFLKITYKCDTKFISQGTGLELLLIRKYSFAFLYKAL